MPFPSTRVVHPRWAQHHRGSAEGQLPSRADLSRPGSAEGGWNPVTGPQEPATAPYAPGTSARVQRLPNRDQGGDAAGQDVTVTAYLVQVPMTSPPVHLGDVVTVTSNPDDAQLEGRDLLVTDVTYGSTPFLRDLTCTLDLSDHGGG